MIHILIDIHRFCVKIIYLSIYLSYGFSSFFFFLSIYLFMTHILIDINLSFIYQ